MEITRAVVFGLLGIIGVIISIALLMEKGERFGSNVEANQGCLRLCEGIGYVTYEDLSADDCFAKGDGYRYMKMAQGEIENGCCCAS